MMTEVNNEILNYIQSYYEKHKKRPSVKTIYENLENVSKRRFYESFPDGIGSACKLLGIPIDQKQIESTKKARKTKKDKPRISEETERIRENKDILALKPEIFRLMRSLGVDTPSEALRQAKATAIAMNPWVLNRGVKKVTELIDLLVKERGDAIKAANSLKAESEVRARDLKELTTENIRLRVENGVLTGMPIINYLTQKGLSNYVVVKAKSLGWDDDIIGFINEYIKGYFVVLNNWKISDTTLKECIRRYKKDIQGDTERRFISYEI